MRTRANECLLIVHSYRSVVYTLQERCAHPATTAAASKTRAETVQGLQCAGLQCGVATRALPLAIAYILKRSIEEGTQPAQKKNTYKNYPQAKSAAANSSGRRVPLHNLWKSTPPVF